MKKSFIIVTTVIFLVLVSSGVYFYLFEKPSQVSLENQQESSHPPCLRENEVADYLHVRAESFVPSLPLTILIQNKNTKAGKFRFSIDSVRPSEAWPLSNHMFKCGFYMVRQFNFDTENLKALSGFREEIWKYQYNGEGEKILTLAERDDKGINHYFFSPDFRIDRAETYIALVRSWYGEPENHALVIKDLKTMKDKYVITLKELMENCNIEVGTIQLSGWGENLFQFEVLNDQNPWFRFYIDTGKLDIYISGVSDVKYCPFPKYLK